MSLYTLPGSDLYIAQDRAINELLTEIRASYPLAVAVRGNIRTNPIKRRVKDLFDSFGLPEAYRTSFWVALAEGRPYHRRLWERSQTPRATQ